MRCWSGVTAVAMLALQGGIYLEIRSEGELQKRMARVIPACWLASPC